jgi:hypothetical protein
MQFPKAAGLGGVLAMVAHTLNIPAPAGKTILKQT